MAAIKELLLERMDPRLATLLVATLPVVEARGAIPLGVSLGLPLGEALVLSLIGNFIPVVPLFFLFRPVLAWLKGTVLFKTPSSWLDRRVRANQAKVARYGYWGLVALVAVPLPSTGAWTGVMVAALLGLSFRRSMAAVALGTAIAGLIVSSLILFGLSVS